MLLVFCQQSTNFTNLLNTVKLADKSSEEAKREVVTVLLRQSFTYSQNRLNQKGKHTDCRGQQDTLTAHSHCSYSLEPWTLGLYLPVPWLTSLARPPSLGQDKWVKTYEKLPFPYFDQIQTLQNNCQKPSINFLSCVRDSCWAWAIYHGHKRFTIPRGHLQNLLGAPPRNGHHQVFVGE